MTFLSRRSVIAPVLFRLSETSNRDKTNVVSYCCYFLYTIDQDMYLPGGEMHYNESLYVLVTFIEESER